MSREEWNRLPLESAKAFAAFSVYRDMGAERSIDKAYAAYMTREPQQQLDNKSTSAKRASRYWGEWSIKFRWVERARAYDDHLAQQLQDDYEAKLLRRQQQTLRDLLRDAEAQMRLFLGKLEKATMYDVRDLYTLARLRSELEDQIRRSLRMPVSTADVTSGGEPINSAPIEFVWTDMNDNGGHDSETDSD